MSRWAAKQPQVVSIYAQVQAFSTAAKTQAFSTFTQIVGAALQPIATQGRSYKAHVPMKAAAAGHRRL
ncbi:hypothetical protein DMX12_17085 [Pseudomonas sp. MB-090624]|nr:hypothetical protein DMX12_17085 [Pseudomonas sp. MB-090624]